MVTKHVKPRKMGEAGGIIQARALSMPDKVQVVCPKCGKPTRVGHKTVRGRHKKFRICKRATAARRCKEDETTNGKTKEMLQRRRSCSDEEVRLQERHADPEAR